MKMEMQQMIEHLLACQEHMKEMMAANQAKADANLKEIKEERIAD
jgi:hypothetical protein